MVPPALSTNRRVPISTRRFALLLSELNKELREKATEVLIFLNERAYEHLLRKPGYIVLYTARNVVIYRLLVKANKSKFCSHFSLLLCGRFERSGVPASFRAPNKLYTNRVDLPTDVAVQVVSLVFGGVVYPKRLNAKCGHHFQKLYSKISF